MAMRDKKRREEIKNVDKREKEWFHHSVPVSEVANKEKKVPLSWITEDGHDVTEEMMAYLRPLILGEPAMQYENGIPVHIELY